MIFKRQGQYFSNLPLKQNTYFAIQDHLFQDLLRYPLAREGVLRFLLLARIQVHGLGIHFLWEYIIFVIHNQPLTCKIEKIEIPLHDPIM